jgi:hypothetical protein
MECNAEICTCYENEVKSGACVADFVCNTLGEDLEEFAKECCGW